MADEELKKAFQELQFKTNETRQRIALGERTKRANLQKKAISEATAKALQVEDVSPDYKYYQSVGRMFILSSKEFELERHQKEANDFKSAADAIDKQREYLEKGLKEAEENLRELVQSRRS